MAATVTIRVQYGEAPGTMSDAVSGIDLCSADSAVNSEENRASNPVSLGARSYEKWLRARVDEAPDNYVKDFKIWGDGACQENTELYYGITDTYTTPTDGNSSVAVTSFETAVSGSKATWDESELTEVGDLTDYLVLQLDVGGSATPGNWTQETLNYQYTEA